jgi:uroporphyrinogen-III synthase
MRLLVTRPEPDGERTAQVLRAQGHEVMLAPMLRIEAIPNAGFGAGPWGAVLMTSANGPRVMAKHPRLKELLGLPVLTVGRSSAEAARAAGFTNVESADGDGEDLVRLVAVRFVGVEKPLLYPAGEDRARNLFGDLAKYGIAVETAVVYRAAKAARLSPEVQTALQAGGVDGVIHFSQRSVETYLECTQSFHQAALAPVHFCLSGRAASPLLSAGAQQIIVSPTPEESALLALVTPRP